MKDGSYQKEEIRMKKFIVFAMILGILLAGIRKETGVNGTNDYIFETGQSSEVYYFGKQITPNQVLDFDFDSVGEWNSFTRTAFTSSSGNIVVSINYRDFLNQATLSTNVLSAYGNITMFPTSLVECQIGNPVGITINITGNIKISHQ